MLVNELPNLWSTIPQHRISILSRIIINSVDPLTTNNSATNTFHSTVKSESITINELQQYIEKMEWEIIFRSYNIILQLLKHNDIDDKTNLIDHNYFELLHSD
jgi:hypothetical protein